MFIIVGNTESPLVRTTEERRKFLKPYVDAMLAALPIGEAAEYYMMNPERCTSGTNKALWSRLSIYNIKDGNTLKAFTEWNLSDGMRQEFEEIQEALLYLPEIERAQYVEAAGEPEAIHKRKVVHYYLRRLPPGGIGAYDFTIALCNCLIGRNLRLITEEETSEYAERLVYRTKESYRSWYDYTMGFAIGLEFWSYPMPSNYISNERNRLMRMLTLKNSPMLKVPL
ncbi:DUF1266 domain-containing protein [Paenibacillus fonticola]|uniref:DUF1266 domain-containing protein n=1 Tax=Paenibacillus fonticola TaxID=379896 RepID=UPI00035D5318|nr:DUF1266 domain-containing protein [Paenibacillus fonticola]